MSRDTIFTERYTFQPVSQEDTYPFFLKDVELDQEPYYGDSVRVTVKTEPNVDGDYYVTVDLVWGDEVTEVWDTDYPAVVEGMDIQGSFTLDIPDDESVEEFELVVEGGHL